MDREQEILAKRIIGGVIIVLLIGTVFYKFQESLSWIDSFYFSVITLTTVGYGDISPVTPIGKLFTAAYALVGIGFLGIFINGVTKARLDKKVQETLEKEQKEEAKQK